jgi:hypothetical protein
MITTNLPQLVHELNLLADVQVHDLTDRIEIKVAKPVDLQELDDLVCDALFADPLARKEDVHAWTVHLAKRDHLRGASDLSAVVEKGRVGYHLRPAA